MANKKYTYEDWLNGKVTLIYASTYSNKGEKITQVDWDRIVKTDIPKIKEKQAELFESRCENLLVQLKNQFEARYANSEMKTAFYEEEWKQCETLIFEPIPDAKEIFVPQWDTSLLSRDLLEIQYYINQHFYKGIPDDFSHVHSPNNKYQNQGTPSNQVLAHVFWYYYKWLVSLNQKETDADKYDNSYQNKDWFKVGLKFANGELDELFEVSKIKKIIPNFSDIARQLGNKSFRPYLSESYNSRTGESNKNIFANEGKITKLLNYCKLNDIEVVASFYQRIEAKNPHFLKRYRNGTVL